MRRVGGRCGTKKSVFSVGVHSTEKRQKGVFEGGVYAVPMENTARKNVKEKERESKRGKFARPKKNANKIIKEEQEASPVLC